MENPVHPNFDRYYFSVVEFMDNKANDAYKKNEKELNEFQSILELELKFLLDKKTETQQARYPNPNSRYKTPRYIANRILNEINYQSFDSQMEIPMDFPYELGDIIFKFPFSYIDIDIIPMNLLKLIQPHHIKIKNFKYHLPFLVDKSFTRIKSVRIFNCSKIPDLRCLSTLQYISIINILDKNKKIEIYPGGLQKIKEIGLEGCGIKSIEELHLKKTEILNLYNNLIKDLDFEYIDKTSLRLIFLEGNPLSANTKKKLHAGFEVLHIDDFNDMWEYGRWLDNEIKLAIYFEDMVYYHLEPESSYHLYINNYDTSKPFLMENLHLGIKSIRILNCSGIPDLQDISTLHHISIINTMDRNKKIEIYPGGLKNIKEINLEDCGIESIEELQLTNITQFLHLQDNLITDLDFTYINKLNLRQIYLNGNPLSENTKWELNRSFEIMEKNDFEDKWKFDRWMDDEVKLVIFYNEKIYYQKWKR